jgi:hypothetical protein
MLGAGGAALNQEADMKNWWRKWTYEIPLAFSDALWEVCVVQFADFLDRLTLRKAIELVLIFIIALAFIQTLPLDLAFLFAGDTLMYLEFLIAIRLAAGRVHLREVLRFALRMAQLTMRTLRTAIRHSATRLARWREQKPVPVAKPRRHADSSDDDPAFGGAFVLAGA